MIHIPYQELIHPSSYPQQVHLSLVLVVEDVGQVATAAVLAVVHGGHEDTGTALEACQ
jgi:hypothetical protein